MGVKTNVRVDGVMVVAGLVVVGGLVLWWKSDKIIQGVKDTGTDIKNDFTPSNPDNVVNYWFAKLTGTETKGDDSLGAKIYCWTHPNELGCQ